MTKLDFIRKDDLFKGLSEDQLQVINRESEEINVDAGKCIIRENELSDYVYILESGEVVVTKEDKETGISHQIGVLEPGAVIGEMSVIDDEPRSASAHASKYSTLIRLSIKKLRTHVVDEGLLSKFLNIPLIGETLLKHTPIYPIVLQNIAKKVVARLRTTNNVVVEGMRKDILNMRARAAMSQFAINVMIVICLYVIAAQTIVSYKNLFISSTLISIPLMILFGVPIFVMILKSGYPLSVYGLTLKGSRHAIIESTLFTIPLLLGIVLYKWLLILFDPSFASRSIFDMTLSLTPGMSEHTLSPLAAVALVGLYFIFVPAQELIVRGALQSSFQTLLIGPHRFFWAIIISNLIFSVFHTHVSLGFGLIVYIPGLFWGWLYSRQHTLVGVTISHLLIGAWAIFIVGLV